jgi:Protein of unknown function (DUF2735)
MQTHYIFSQPNESRARTPQKTNAAQETNMTTNFDRGSATIYQFPVRGRFAESSRGDESNAAANAPQVAKIVFGSGWYHDEAIQEAERARKN